jgi:hypothetical protein
MITKSSKGLQTKLMVKFIRVSAMPKLVPGTRFTREYIDECSALAFSSGFDPRDMILPTRQCESHRLQIYFVSEEQNLFLRHLSILYRCCHVVLLQVGDD